MNMRDFESVSTGTVAALKSDAPMWLTKVGYWWRPTMWAPLFRLIVAALLLGGAQQVEASLVGDQISVSIFVQSGVGTIVGSSTATVGPGDEFVVTETVGPSLLVTHRIDFSDSGLNIATTSTGSGGGSTAIRFNFTSLDMGGPITGFQKTAGLNQVLNPSFTPNSISFDLGFFTSPSQPRTTSISIDSGVVDGDNDGVADVDDNCPSVSNADQTDSEHDGTGDVCDLDDDNDSLVDVADNCPLVANPDQADADGDGLGNSCDADLDGDGLLNDADNCPAASNTDQTDSDHDGVGDECDLDDDNDGLADSGDNCTAVPNPGQDDLDGDGIGDSCDADLDGDGAINEVDNCPIDANVGQDDTDGDNAGDVCDPDADNDIVANEADNCPLIANPNQVDSDHDGQGDVCDSDLDGDNVANGSDNCPSVANSGQADFDSDGSGDACDSDTDGDGVNNAADQCSGTAVGSVTDPTSGCSLGQLCPCDGPRGTVMSWRNHGKYVSCVAHSAEELASKGLISSAQKDAMIATAGQSNCGK